MDLPHTIEFCRVHEIVHRLAPDRIGREQDFHDPGFLHADIGKMPLFCCKGGDFVEERDAGGGIAFFKGFCYMAIIK